MFANSIVAVVDSGFPVLDAALEVSSLLLGAGKLVTACPAACAAGIEGHAIAIPGTEGELEVGQGSGGTVGHGKHGGAGASTTHIHQAHAVALGSVLKVCVIDCSFNYSSDCTLEFES